jgi:NAD(P)H-quinone oxidoreductase subunit 3
VTWTHPLVLALPLAVLTLLVAGVLLRREAKRAPPHPEMHPRNAWRQYYARFALLVIAFVVFDMEMAFMYPWAVAFRRVGMVAFADMLVFVAILAVALAYMWRTGVLEIETPPR